MPRGLRHEELSFLARAPFQQVHRGLVALPVDRVFAGLAARPEGWPAWLPLARECHYEGVPPHGVGAIRLLSLPGGVRARERVLAWDDNERFAYRVEELNVPGTRAFMEEWTLAPAPGERTELQWTLAGDCATPVRVLLRAARTPMTRVFAEATRRMAAVF
jgi:hypothetical protein